MPRIFDNIALELLPALRGTLNREILVGVSDEKPVGLGLSLIEEDRLTILKDDIKAREPKIICSLRTRKDEA